MATKDSADSARSRWMAVEVMGHRQHVGLVTEESKFGATFCRIEELQKDGTFKTLSYGGSAIFSHREIPEEQARRHVLPKSWRACGAFLASVVLPVACELCGCDEDKHTSQPALPPGPSSDAEEPIDDDALRDPVLAERMACAAEAEWRAIELGLARSAAEVLGRALRHRGPAPAGDEAADGGPY